MNKNPMANENKTSNHESETVPKLTSNLEKKSWLGIGCVVALSLFFMFTGIYWKTTSFIYVSFLSISAGCCFLNINRLKYCIHFLKCWMKNQPETTLNELLTSQPFKLTRRCLHQFALSVGLVMFAGGVFINPLVDGFSSVFDLFFLSAASGIIYVVCLLFAHTFVTTQVGHPIIQAFSTFKPVNNASDFYDPLDPTDPVNMISAHQNELDRINNEIEKIHQIHEDLWRHNPLNPASAEYQANQVITSSKPLWDDF